MADYIDRQAVVYQLNKMKHEDKQPRAFERAIRVVEGHEAADVKPVVHGHWIERYRNGFGNMVCECSNCHSNSKRRNFCFNCGADMRGNDNEREQMEMDRSVRQYALLWRL